VVTFDLTYLPFTNITEMDEDDIESPMDDVGEIEPAG
jgi:hypothetical protein